MLIRVKLNLNGSQLTNAGAIIWNWLVATGQSVFQCDDAFTMEQLSYNNAVSNYAFLGFWAIILEKYGVFTFVTKES